MRAYADGNGYADGRVATPTSLYADDNMPTAAVGVCVRRRHTSVRRRLLAVGVSWVSRSDLGSCSVVNVPIVCYLLGLQEGYFFRVAHVIDELYAD